jgi:hypothetical protein
MRIINPHPSVPAPSSFDRFRTGLEAGELEHQKILGDINS